MARGSVYVCARVCLSLSANSAALTIQLSLMLSHTPLLSLLFFLYLPTPFIFHSCPSNLALPCCFLSAAHQSFLAARVNRLNCVAENDKRHVKKKKRKKKVVLPKTSNRSICLQLFALHIQYKTRCDGIWMYEKCQLEKHFRAL